MMIDLAIGLLVALAAQGIESFDLGQGRTVTGPVVKENAETVFVDLGHTILALPRRELVARRRVAVSDEIAPGAVGASAESGVAGRLWRAGRGAEASVRECSERVGSGVVLVKVPGALGSGFVIDSEGWVVTNAHVVAGERKISVTVFEKSDRGFEKRVFEDVELVAINPYWDLALLRIPARQLADVSLAPLLLADSAGPEAGEGVFAIGNPLGLERSVSEGIVSTSSRAYNGMLYLQTTAAINPGNSGGPLFDLRGRVVGVTTWGFLGTEGLNFAIPGATLKEFLDHRDAFAFDKDQPNTGYRYLDPPRRSR